MAAQPNVLIVTTDQQRIDSLRCYGSTFMCTPGFDHVAEAGTRFTRAYCPSAVCTPSRVSLLSGQYLARHGVWSVGVNAGEGVELLSHLLGRAGYQTCLVGKAHFEAYLASPAASRESIAGYAMGYGGWTGPYYGFDTVQLALGHSVYGIAGHYGAWLADRLGPDEVSRLGSADPVAGDREFGGNGYDWDMPTALCNASWTVDTAIDYLERDDRERPFFLSINFQDPHHPHALPRDFNERVDPALVPLPRFDPADLLALGPHFRAAHEGQLSASEFSGRWPVSGQHDGFDYSDIPVASQRRGRSYYYSLVQLVDRQLLRLWDCLTQLGLKDNTLVVVTSDHGELLGDHGLWMKGPFHYEELTRIPLLMMGPGIDRGSVRDHVVSLVDVVPTILAAAGADPGEAALGGMDLLAPQATTDERTVLCETVLDWQGLICRSVIGRHGKLTHYAGEGYGELFDLDNDPGERINLWDEPSAAGMRSWLLGRLLDHDSRILAPRTERIAYA